MRSLLFWFAIFSPRQRFVFILILLGFLFAVSR
jgi:hypothetical protein